MAKDEYTPDSNIIAPPVNRRRGFRRLIIATVGPYFGWWAFYGGVSAVSYNRYKTELQSDTIGADLYGYYSEQSMQAMHRVFDSILWGIVVPVIALVVGGVAYWVYRGFKPRKL